MLLRLLWSKPAEKDLEMEGEKLWPRNPHASENEKPLL
jgi:hypothetical protein